MRPLHISKGLWQNLAFRRAWSVFGWGQRLLNLLLSQGISRNLHQMVRWSGIKYEFLKYQHYQRILPWHYRQSGCALKRRFPVSLLSALKYPTPSQQSSGCDQYLNRRNSKKWTPRWGLHWGRMFLANQLLQILRVCPISSLPAPRVQGNRCALLRNCMPGHEYSPEELKTGHAGSQNGGTDAL